MTKLIAATMMSAFLIAGPAVARNQVPQSPLVDALVKCKAETDTGARLRCYDIAAGALEQASVSGAVVLVDREDVRKTRRSLFGFTLPSLPFFGGDDSAGEEAAKEIEVTLTSVRTTSDGKYVFAFADGSSWQTTEVRTLRPRVGEKVMIRKAAVGGYFMNVNGRSVRGMRIK